MDRTENLKIAIDAEITPGGSGGVAQAILGMIYALGKLSHSCEEYVIIVSTKQQRDWLAPYIGPNEHFILKPQPRLSYRRLIPLYEVLKSLPLVVQVGQHLLRLLKPEVAISDGFYESLGCDVVHFPHQGFVICALPTVYNPWDLQHLHYPQFFTAQVIAYREKTFPVGCHSAHTVIATSQWAKDDIIQHYEVCPHKVQVIPMGPPTQAYAEPSQDYLSIVKKKYQLEQPFAFYPSQCWPHKNHIRLLEALGYLRDKHGLTMHLVCTGAFYKPFWPSIEKRIAELRLQPEVKFLGYVPEEDLRAIYRLSQFLVMPTLFESDSLPIYEAWFEGIPVVCSNVTSLPDQVMNAALLFNPNEVESIANVMLKVATNAELRQELCKRGYQRLKDFDWERTAKAYRAVYRRAAGYPLSDEDQWLLSWDWMREPQKKKETQP